MLDFARSPDTRPGLIRMIVVNTTAMRNRIEEVPLDSSVAILAENGSGKTSLMLLVPFFFGSNPNHIQQSKHGNKNFIDFYLPTDASYVALEYRNSRGEVRSVVVTASPNRMDVRYRFIRGPLSVELFRDQGSDGVFQFVKNVDFESHAKDLGHDLCNRLVTTTKEYRSIIQGVSVSSPRRDLSMVEEYGIGQIRTPIEGVDSLFLTALSNKFSIPDLLTVVTRRLANMNSGSDGAGSGYDRRIRILGSANTDENRSTTRDYRGYQQVMKLEKTYREAQALEVERLAFEDHFKTTYGSLKSTTAGAKTQLEDLKSTILNVQSEKKMKLADIEKSTQELIRKRVETEAAIEGLNKLISEIDTEEGSLIAGGAPYAGEKASKRNMIEVKLKTLRDAISALNGEREHIEQRFAEIIRETREGQAKEVNVSNARLLELSEEIDAIKTRMREEFRVQQSALRETRAQSETAMNADLEKRQSEVDNLSDRLAAVTAPEDVVNDRLREASSLEVKEAERLKVLKVVEGARAKALSLKDDAARAAEALDAAEKKKFRTERSYEDILRQTTPKEGSLRHWLEENMPDWRDSIGKVISEEILDKRGLAPDHTQGDGLYGVRIDIGKLSSGCASLEELERDQESLFQELSDCEAEVDKLKANKKSTQNQLSIASSALNKQESELALAESAVSGAASRLKAAKQIELEKIEECRSSIAEKIQFARDARKKLHAELQALRQRHAAQSTEDHLKIDARIEGAIEHLKNEWAVGKENGLKLADRHRSAIRDLESQRDTAIADRGSDRSQLETYLNEKSDLEKKMQEIPELERLHAAWTDFQKDKAPRRITAKDRVAFLSSELERISAEVEHFSKEEGALKSLYEEKLAETEAKIDALRDLISRAKAKLEQHGKHESKAGECREPSEIAGLIFDLDKTYSRGKAIGQEIATHVRVLRSNFRSADGAVRNAFTEWEAGKEGWKEDSRWLPIFEDWYEIYHHSLRVGIEDRVNRVGGMLRNSYNRIVRIDSDVDTISRKLRKSITKLTGFKRISDVDISIRSSIRSMGYYASMTDFIRAFEEWEQNEDTVPISEIIDAMDQFFRHWSVDEDPVIDLDSIIYLEGQFVEGDEIRKLGSGTDLGQKSSTGGSAILRQVILTGLAELIRGGSNVRFTWCLDELGALDSGNSIGLVEMLDSNGISLVVSAPSLQPQVMRVFGNRLTILKAPNNSSTLASYDPSKSRRKSLGIREWDEQGNLNYPAGDTQ